MTGKNRLLIIFVIITALCIIFSGCSYTYSKTPAGSNSGNSGNNSQGGVEKPDNLSTFVAYLVKENGQPYTPPKGTTVSVTWLSYDGAALSKPATVDENGKAVCTDKLDGEYFITIDGLPSIVGYNPNIYSADNLHPETTITIFNVVETYVRYPGKGVTSAPDSVITFQLSTPYYRFKFTEDNQVIWCRLGPLSGANALGKYEIESMCNIYNNEANPEFSYFNGSAQFVNDKYPLATIGTGGVCSSFTKNFFYVFNHATTQEGEYYYYFSLKCEKRKTESYPIYLDLHIRKVPTEAEDLNRPTLYVGEENFYDENGVLKDFGISRGSNLVATSGNLMDYNFKIDEDGYYRQVNEDGTLGNYVFTKIIGGNPVIADGGWQKGEVSVKDYVSQLDYTFLLRGLSTTLASSYIDNPDNPNAFTEEEMAPILEKRIAYFDYCNAKDVDFYPVTAELKSYLQHYCTGQLIFCDGESLFEEDGYISDHESMWKIFCYTLQ